MRNDIRQKQALPQDSSTGMLVGISAIIMMGYAIGSPQVAPMLPPSMERPFAKLHNELHGVGEKAARSVAGTWSKATWLISG